MLRGGICAERGYMVVRIFVKGGIFGGICDERGMREGKRGIMLGGGIWV